MSIEIQRDLLAKAERLVKGRVTEQTWEAFTRRLKNQRAKAIAEELGMPLAAVHKAKHRVATMIREEIATMLNQKAIPE